MDSRQAGSIRIRIVVALLAVLWSGVVVGSAAEWISLRAPEDVAARRDSLIQYIWGSKGWPVTREPTFVEMGAVDAQYSVLEDSAGNLERIDRYVVCMPNGFSSLMYHFHPRRGNGNLFLYHSGHSGADIGGGFRLEDRVVNGDTAGPGVVIPRLIREGFAVLAISMPLAGNYWSTIPLGDSLRVTICTHDQMFRYLDHPYQYFFEPIVVALNYIDDHYAYASVSMTGLSGGGWTTTLYAALDPRIQYSFPVAGSSPMESCKQDAEQSDPGLYAIANYTELYVLGSSGPGRRQTQILNRYDPIVFSGEDFVDWVDQVAGAVTALGQGTYRFFLDETHQRHMISPAALQVILEDNRPSPPSIPILVPISDSPVPLSCRLEWMQGLRAERFWCQIAYDSLFNNLAYEDSIIPYYSSTVTPPGLRRDAQYYWRVRAINGLGMSSWSPREAMTTVRNNPPVFTTAQNLAATEDSFFVFLLHAVDPDSASYGDVVRYRAVRLPRWAALDTLSGKVWGTPRLRDLTDATLEIEAYDNAGGRSTWRDSVKIRHINHPPIFRSLHAPPAHEDSAYILRLLASDPDSALFGDVLRYSVVLMPRWASLDSLSGEMRGTPSLEHLADTTAEVEARDNWGATARLRFTIPFVHTNHRPAFLTDGTPGKAPNAALEHTPYLKLHAASDIDSALFGDRIRYALPVSPHWLSVDSLTGCVRGTPGEGDGDTVYAVIASDGVLADTLRVILPVVSVNDPPSITGIPRLVMAEDSSLTLALDPYLADPDNSLDQLHCFASLGPTSGYSRSRALPGRAGRASAAEPQKGAGRKFLENRERGAEPLVLYRVGLASPTLSDSVVITVDPSTRAARVSATKNFFGTNIPIVFSVVDGGGLVGRDTAFLTVTPINDPPVLAALPTAALDEDDTLTVLFRSWFPYLADPDDADSLHSWSIQNGRGVHAHVGTEGMTLVPASNWNGVDTLRVTVTDPGGLSASRSLIVTVRPVNDSPRFAGVAGDTLGFTETLFSARAICHDVDDADSTLTYSLSGAASWLHVDRDGMLHGRPLQQGRFVWTLKVFDHQGGSDTLTFAVTIRSVDELHDLANSAPGTFVLKQNYPNPFNPSTTIRIGLPEPSMVRVTVYGIAGQVVSRLLDERRVAGYVDIPWNAELAATGVYFVEMRAQSVTDPRKTFLSIRKMMLLK